MLIAKAISTAHEFPEEARTCALSAIQLIDKYGIPIGGAPSAREEELAHVRTMLEFVRHQLNSALTTNERLENELAETADEVEQLRAKIVRRKPRSSLSDDGTSMQARFKSFCRRCGRRVDVGDTIWWFGHVRGLICESCHDDTEGG